jgi:uncharacterized protein YndB with AHSA1/START domain
VRDYAFLTTWLLRDAPVERTFEVLLAGERYPQWWPGVVRVQTLEPGGPDSVGKLSRSTWKSALPYELTFDLRVARVERPHLIEGHASGELEGVGTWRVFGGADGTTAVVYDWRVRTTRRWMNAVAPLLRPAFALNHDWIMRRGADGLAREVGGTVLARD